LTIRSNWRVRLVVCLSVIAPAAYQVADDQTDRDDDSRDE
jgi:hypothetical protein